MTDLTEEERAKKDISLLKERLDTIVKLSLNKKYEKGYDIALRYYKDAIYYMEKRDYFTSFGCANYAYGILDCMLMSEGKY